MLSKALRAAYRAQGVPIPRQHPEQSFQITVAAYLDKYLPEPYWYTAIDHTYHGERRGKTLRDMGVKKGVLDMLILGPDRFIGWIENKSPEGGLTTEQKAMLPMLVAFGHRTAVCRTLEDVVDAVSSWGIQWLSESRSTNRIKRGLLKAMEEVPIAEAGSRRRTNAGD